MLASMRARAEGRNRDMLGAGEHPSKPVIVDYDRDVLPLTPSGNATERHMLVAYIRAAERHSAVGAQRRHSGRPSWARRSSRSGHDRG